MKEGIKIGASIAAPVIFALSLVADSITVFQQFENFNTILMIISGFVTFIFAIYYAVFTKKAVDQSRKIDLLEKEICKGNKYSLNEAMVIMDIEQKKYIIEIRKEYEIISENIKWFECQFYCNKILANAEEALANYRNDRVTWEELNISASLQYKNPGESDYLRQPHVRVKQVAEGNNYKQFHIEYKTDEGDKLDIKKGTQIILTYKYEVPVTKWGSYLNRYVTYWGEETKISIACKDEQKLMQNDLRLYKTSNIGEPIFDPRGGRWDVTQKGNIYYRELKIKPASCCKYILSWNANAFFNIEGMNLNTQIVEDQLQLTQY